MRKDMKSGKNDEAVSPVIGVILMVAITVILAAVIAAFVFGMGTPEKTPTVNMQLKRAQVGTANITLYHSGGETIRLSDVKLIVYSDTSHKTTVNPLLEFGSVTALPPGSELILNFGSPPPASPSNITKIYIDGVANSSALGTPTFTGTNYQLTTAGQSITVEFWYIPSGQMLGRLEGATIS